ncbi:MAG TPA: aldo/keto reductase [Ignavibacteria bacterium]|nr:aldo/keto reductase [Ignavibacteria bacterium]
MNLPELGFGCYRIDHRVAEHYETLTKAIRSGITLIDTSANYSDGGSEVLVGNVLTEMLENGDIKREDLTIVTKVGYIQGQNYKNAVKRRDNDNPFPEVVEYDEGLWHCIHPEFLEDQLKHQLTRLNTDYIDAYLLHNPEYYLSWADKEWKRIDAARDEFYVRIRMAFEWLHQKSIEGVIKSYGVSSNTFVADTHKFDFVSLETLHHISVETTEKLGGENYFKFAQMPFNLFEIGAMMEKNQDGNTKTVLEFAKENEINVLTNRPLNAITTKGLVRLADFDYKEHNEKAFLLQIQKLANMEDDMINEKLPNYEVNVMDQKTLEGLFKFADKINDNWEKFGSIEHFNDVIEHYFGPRINYLMDYFEENFPENDMSEYFNNYLTELYKLLNMTSNYYKVTAARRSSFIHGVIDTLADEKYYNLTLSQKALLLILSVDGVDTVLVGARKESYIDDVLPVLEMPKIENAKEILLRLRDELENAQYRTPDL